MEKPRNIVVILADEIGYGDLGCYGATDVKTPHEDRLARERLRFTEAHAPASMCTPTSYSLLTGQYSFRNLAVAGAVLPRSSPISIAADQRTLADLLHNAGYATGLVSKWHLGLGTAEAPVDFNRTLRPFPRCRRATQSSLRPARVRTEICPSLLRLDGAGREEAPRNLVYFARRGCSGCNGTEGMRDRREDYSQLRSHAPGDPDIRGGENRCAFILVGMTVEQWVPVQIRRMLGFLPTTRSANIADLGDLVVVVEAADLGETGDAGDNLVEVAFHICQCCQIVLAAGRVLESTDGRSIIDRKIDGFLVVVMLAEKTCDQA